MNKPGSTVEIAKGLLISSDNINIVDLPGIQSFTPASDDEKLTLKQIFN